MDDGRIDGRAGEWTLCMGDVFMSSSCFFMNRKDFSGIRFLKIKFY